MSMKRAIHGTGLLISALALGALLACGDSGSAPKPPASAATPEPTTTATPEPTTEPAPADAETGAMAMGEAMDMADAEAMPDADAVARGRETYQLYCASCHGATGDGDGPVSAGLEPKPAKHSDGNYMNELTDAHLHKVIKEGGSSVGKSPLMAPWGGTLSDAQIDDVVAYIRTLAVPPYEGSSMPVPPYPSEPPE
jgi:mono/diheme cytochrome c family protein